MAGDANIISTREENAMTEIPAPDWRRCDAIAKAAESPSVNGPWNARAHRCGHYATRQRDGYQLCPQHFQLAGVRYAPDAHRLRRIHEYAAMMAAALGDEP